MELTKEQIKIIADKSNKLDLGQLDKDIICEASNCTVFSGMGKFTVMAALDRAYISIEPGDDGCSGRTDARTWSIIMSRALHDVLENPRTDAQRKNGLLDS